MRRLSTFLPAILSLALLGAAGLQQLRADPPARPALPAPAPELPRAPSVPERIQEPGPVQNILNVDFGSPTPAKIGKAAVGLTERDVWNAAGPGFESDYTVHDLRWADGTSSGVALRVVNLPGNWGMNAPGLDPMYAGYSYSWYGETASLIFTGLPSGLYDLYFYANADHSGRGSGPSDNTGVSVEVSSPAHRWESPVRFTGQGDAWTAMGWQPGKQFVVHEGIEVGQGHEVKIVLHNGVQGTGNSGCLVNGLQLVHR